MRVEAQVRTLYDTYTQASEPIDDKFADNLDDLPLEELKEVSDLPEEIAWLNNRGRVERDNGKPELAN